MGYDGVGKIYIPLEDFNAFVMRYLPEKMHSQHVVLGYAPGNGISFTTTDMEIDYAHSTECDPHDWFKPPEFLKKKTQLLKTPSVTRE